MISVAWMEIKCDSCAKPAGPLTLHLSSALAIRPKAEYANAFPTLCADCWSDAKIRDSFVNEFREQKAEQARALEELVALFEEFEQEDPSSKRTDRIAKDDFENL